MQWKADTCNTQHIYTNKTELLHSYPFPDEQDASCIHHDILSLLRIGKKPPSNYLKIDQ